MKRPLTALLLALLATACGEEEEKPSDTATLNRTPQANDMYLTVEAMTVDAADATATAWLKDTYLTKLSSAPGVAATRHYAPLGGPPPFPFPGAPTDLSVFHFADQAMQTGFGTSSAATEAATALAATTGVTQVSRSMYGLSSSADNGDSTGVLPNITMLGLVVDPAVEAEVLDWEDNTHVPWVMGYQGIAKIVRYEKIAGGTNDATLPKYLEIFYYRSQEAADGQQADQDFIDAEADRKATWTDAQLGINPIVATKIAP